MKIFLALVVCLRHNSFFFVFIQQIANDLSMQNTETNAVDSRQKMKRNTKIKHETKAMKYKPAAALLPVF